MSAARIACAGRRERTWCRSRALDQLARGRQHRERTLAEQTAGVRSTAYAHRVRPEAQSRTHGRLTNTLVGFTMRAWATTLIARSAPRCPGTVMVAGRI